MRSAFRSVPSAVAVVMAGALAACSSDATSTEASPSPSPALATASTGNGAPSGAHYNLNIIAVPRTKNGDLTGGGNVIFVGLGTKTAAVTTKILLEQSASAGVFEVLDKDGTDVFVRGTGKSSFRNVTSNLTTISLDPVLDAAAVDACGGTTVNLFDGCLEGYFWQYDNNGLKLLQLRFYSETLQ